MVIAVLAAFLLTIPALGYQDVVEPLSEPANLMFVGDFGDLGQLVPYNTLILTNETGDSQDFAVAWSRLYPVDELPPEVLDGPAGGGSVVTLVSGTVEDGDYPMQRVVRAVPVR